MYTSKQTVHTYKDNDFQFSFESKKLDRSKASKGCSVVLFSPNVENSNVNALIQILKTPSYTIGEVGYYIAGEGLSGNRQLKMYAQSLGEGYGDELKSIINELIRSNKTFIGVYKDGKLISAHEVNVNNLASTVTSVNCYLETMTTSRVSQAL